MLQYFKLSRFLSLMMMVSLRERGLPFLRIFMYVFLSGLGLLVVVGLHQLLESRKVIHCTYSLTHTKKTQCFR